MTWGLPGLPHSRPFTALSGCSSKYCSHAFGFLPFSRMRSKGSRFTGVWGLRVCSLDVAQPFAIVRNHSHEACIAVPMVSSATGVTSAGFQHRVASFRAAGNCESQCQGCVQGDHVQIAWQAWHFVRCAEN